MVYFLSRIFSAFAEKRKADSIDDLIEVCDDRNESTYDQSEFIADPKEPIVVAKESVVDQRELTDHQSESIDDETEYDKYGLTEESSKETSGDESECTIQVNLPQIITIMNNIILIHVCDVFLTADEWSPFPLKRRAVKRKLTHRRAAAVKRKPSPGKVPAVKRTPAPRKVAAVKSTPTPFKKPAVKRKLTPRRKPGRERIANPRTVKRNASPHSTNWLKRPRLTSMSTIL